MNEIIPFILSFEGGFTNAPNDPGGATNRGVTLATWQRYCNETGQPELGNADGLRRMTTAQWTEIFTDYYWEPIQCGRIKDKGVAWMLVDFYWHSGGVAVRTLQGLLKGLVVDGIVGQETLTAVNRCGAGLFAEYKSARILFLENLVRRRPSSKRYLKGWLRRVNSINHTSLKLNK